MNIEQALNLAMDMWGSYHDGEIAIPLKAARSFLTGAYIFVNGPPLLDFLIKDHQSETSREQDVLNTGELRKLLDVISKAQNSSIFNIATYNDHIFKECISSSHIYFTEIGLPIPSKDQIDRYIRVFLDSDKELLNVHDTIAIWKTAFPGQSQDLDSSLKKIWSMINRTAVNQCQRTEFIIGIYLLDLYLSGFCLPQSLPESVYRYLEGWFTNSTIPPNNGERSFGYFSFTSSPSLEAFSESLVSRLFNQLQFLRKDTPSIGIRTNPPRTFQRTQFNREIISLSLRLLHWSPKDTSLVPPSAPTEDDLQAFNQGILIGPREDNFCVDWTKRPGTGWNLAASFVFAQEFLNITEVQTSSIPTFHRAELITEEVAQMFRKKFSYLRNKRRGIIGLQHGDEASRNVFRETQQEKAKRQRRSNRKNELRKRRLAVIASHEDWPKDIWDIFQSIGIDGTSSDETDVEEECSLRRIPKPWRSVQVDQLVNFVDMAWISTRNTRCGQQIKKRIGNTERFNSKVQKNLPENLYNKKWISQHLPQILPFLNATPPCILPPISTLKLRD